MAEGDDGEREVLTSLPRSRPVRRSSKRAGRSGDAETPPKPAARAQAAKPASKPARKPAAKAAAKPAPKAAPKKSAPPKPRAKTTSEAPPRVRPQRKVPPAGYAAPESTNDGSSPGATEILATAVQAATELAQIGFSVGRQALASALERLPKP
jgi:outer membrane biosynthesis protein TonB